jgi:methylmalonyl-CoA/ethylmalonyl-CoA epimerase
MILGLDHIAIAVPDFDAAIRRFASDLGMSFEGTEDVAAQKTRTAFFPAPGARIELVAPLGGEGAIATYLEKRGGGLHHIAFRTDDLDGDVVRLKALGYRFTTEAPTAGAHGSRVIFVHPKSADGVLIELAQHASGAHE